MLNIAWITTDLPAALMSLPVIAITIGEPAGIGPEIALRAAWAERHLSRFVLIGDFALLEATARQTDADIRLEAVSADALARIRSPDENKSLFVLDCPLARPVLPGYPDAANAMSVLATLDLAVDGAMDAVFDAIVTAPIQKSVINQAGIAFTGHTEYLAEITNARHVVMLLTGLARTGPAATSKALRVALATVHLPLAGVSGAITWLSLADTIRVLHAGLREKFGMANPRILVSGLNPHAGESGFLGHEETEVIGPVIETMQEMGMNIEGPFSADTLFLPHHLETADCFLVMYHDQGLPVLKYATFGHGVNITLGLPVIRTSVDHGTALDVAMKGVGLADYSSMREAIRTALSLAEERKKSRAFQKA